MLQLGNYSTNLISNNTFKQLCREGWGEKSGGTYFTTTIYLFLTLLFFEIALSDTKNSQFEQAEILCLSYQRTWLLIGFSFIFSIAFDLIFYSTDQWCSSWLSWPWSAWPWSSWPWSPWPCPWPWLLLMKYVNTRTKVIRKITCSFILRGSFFSYGSHFPFYSYVRTCLCPWPIFLLKFNALKIQTLIY